MKHRVTRINYQTSNQSYLNIKELQQKFKEVSARRDAQIIKSENSRHSI